MAITYRGPGTSSGAGTTTATPDWLAGAVGDAILEMIGNKPFSSTPTAPDGTWTQLSTGTSGSVANGADTGSVRATSFVATASSTAAGSATFTVTSGSPTMGRGLRFGFTSGLFSAIGTTLTDTDETVATVSATGSVAAGDIAAGDTLALAVVIKSDLITHTSQSVTVAGCTLSAVTWEPVSTTTQGNDAEMYSGTCTVTAGSSTGTVTYSASSGVGAGATAVSVVRLRESAAVPKAPAPDTRDRRVIRNSLLRR